MKLQDVTTCDYSAKKGNADTIFSCTTQGLRAIVASQRNIPLTGKKSRVILQLPQRDQQQPTIQPMQIIHPSYSPRFHLTMASKNVKTGPIPVTTSSNTTCPDACPLKSKGCYASAGGPLALHWRKVSENGRGDDWQTFVARIAALPAGQLWRHNQAGDLPGENNAIEVSMLAQLVNANEGKRGWTYTHKPVTGDSNEATCNRAAVRQANERGFTINLSADNLAEADELKDADCGPVVVVLPAGSPLAMTTPAGHKVIVCPAQRPNSAATCATCGLCQKQRNVIVGFLAHGTQARAASVIAKN